MGGPYSDLGPPTTKHENLSGLPGLCYNGHALTGTTNYEKVEIVSTQYPAPSTQYPKPSTQNPVPSFSYKTGMS